VYDHSFEGNRAWFRFTLKWTDTKTGETRPRAGMQLYRIEAGKLYVAPAKLGPRDRPLAMPRFDGPIGDNARRHAGR
jgi:hypothetical protein